MASSKDKAIGLKDAYVSGLLDAAGPEVAAEAGAMANRELAGKLDMEQGQQATVHIDSDRGRQFRSNDDRPNFHVTGGGRQDTYQRSYMA